MAQFRQEHLPMPTGLLDSSRLLHYNILRAGKQKPVMNHGESDPGVPGKGGPLRPAIVLVLSALAMSTAQAQWFVATVPADSYPTMLCHNTQNGYVYSCNWAADNVTVIDCAGDSLLTTIAVGEQPHAILYNPVNNRVLCFNEHSKTMSVINGATNTVVSTESLRTYLWDAVRDPVNNKLYVLGHSTPYRVLVVDGSTYVIDTTLPFPFSPYGVCYDSTDDRVYVSTRTDSTVWAIDCASNSIIDSIKVGPSPNKLCWNSRENKVYTATIASSESTVAIIDCATNTVAATVVTDVYPYAVTYDPAENNVWVCNSSNRTLSVIDGATDSVKADIPVSPLRPEGLCAAPNWDHVFCGMWSDTVLVLDAVTYDVIARVGIGGREPSILLHDPIDGRVYTADRLSATVSILLDSGTGIAEVTKCTAARTAVPTLVSRAALLAEMEKDPGLCIFDASGREVLCPNAIPPGICFVRRLSADSRQLTASRKVLVMD
jgi:YVTN family beta-propeller protein